MELREKLLTKLREMGVTDIEVEYSGYGDSGQLESTTYTPKIGTDVDFDSIPPFWGNGDPIKRNLDSAVSDFVWDVISGHYGGFENNEGGGGTVIWDVANDKITLEHYWYIQETDHAPTVVL